MCSCTDRGRASMSTPRVYVEVTDTLSIDFTTGIQRVVRSVVAGLGDPSVGIEVVPVVTPEPGAGFRLLTDDEAERLRIHPAGGRAGRRADDFGVLTPLARRFGDLPATIRLRASLRRLLRRRRQVHPIRPELAVEPEPGSVFLDIEGSWYDPTPRAELLPRLRARGVHTIVFVHDVMPVVHPQWFAPHHIERFGSWIDAHLRHSERVLANSERTAEDLRDLARSSGRNAPEITVVPLGADHPVDAPRPVGLPASIGRFLLVVGTLEPRKNQRIVLDVFDRLHGAHPDLGLVLVGKEGWMVDDLVARIRRHPELDRRLTWLGGIDDEQLAWLYDHAFLCVAPSLYEGLGVPVLEALDRGCATLASTGGAQPEAAAGAAELFEPTDADTLAALVERHLSDPQYHASSVGRARAHRSPTWSDTSRAVAAAVDSLVTGDPAGGR